PAGVAFSESCLGFLAAERGDDDAARAHHAAALAAAVDSGDAAALALAVEGSATVALAAGVPLRAATLLGAAGAMWDSIPTAIATHRPDVDGAIAAVRTELGSARSARELAAGAALDRGGVLAVARGV
ncbi:MAG: AfsR/SARP family transcriptional regulator, partial [Ilumatobacteraceae bacterium]